MKILALNDFTSYIAPIQISITTVIDTMGIGIFYTGAVLTLIADLRSIRFIIIPFKFPSFLFG